MRLAFAWLVAATAPLTVAAAQADVHDLSVEGRARPEYASQGLPLGPLHLMPGIDVAAEYNSNVFAAPFGPADDVILSVAPSLEARLEMPLYSVVARAGLASYRHADHAVEDRTDYRIEASGRYGAGTPTRIEGALRFARAAERRGALESYAQAAAPVRYADLLATAEAERAFGPLHLALNGRFRRLSYEEGLDASGRPLDYAFRDLRSYRFGGRVGVGHREGAQLFLAARLDRRRYDVRPGDPGFDPIIRFDRDADGRRVEIGVRYRVSSLLVATAQAGHLRMRYADARLRPLEAVSFAADLLWNVTPLTSVTAHLERAPDETVSPLSAGNLRTEVALGVDHELLRNLILATTLRHARIAPVGDGARIREYEGALEARYLLAPGLSLTMEARRFRRTSSAPLFAYRAALASIGVRHRL